MIRETLSKKRSPALTSDCWHILRASWNGVVDSVPSFDRTIISEHATRGEARVAARTLLGEMGPQMVGRAREQRDQVLVRRPGYKSLKRAKRAERKTP